MSTADRVTERLGCTASACYSASPKQKTEQEVPACYSAFPKQSKIQRVWYAKLALFPSGTLLKNKCAEGIGWSTTSTTTSSSAASSSDRSLPGYRAAEVMPVSTPTSASDSSLVVTSVVSSTQEAVAVVTSLPYGGRA